MKWSEMAWEKAGPVFEKIITHPFVLGLASGSLPEEKFMYYIRQDALYLEEYTRAMALLASRFGNPQITGKLLEYATSNLDSEQELHERYLSDRRRTEASPTCLLCSSHLWRQVSAAPLEVALASVLPCFAVYARTGRHIYSTAELQGNPYRQWIEVYAGSGFEAPSDSLVELCDSYAEGVRDSLREEMTEAFVTGVRLEWMFWDSAYKMEKWEI